VRKTLLLLAILSVPSLAATDKSYRGSIPFELVLKHIVVNISINNSPSTILLFSRSSWIPATNSR
jgi:hypothetical protein